MIIERIDIILDSPAEYTWQASYVQCLKVSLHNDDDKIELYWLSCLTFEIAILSSYIFYRYVEEISHDRKAKYSLHFV